MRSSRRANCFICQPPSWAPIGPAGRFCSCNQFDFAAGQPTRAGQLAAFVRSQTLDTFVVPAKRTSLDNT